MGLRFLDRCLKQYKISTYVGSSESRMGLKVGRRDESLLSLKLGSVSGPSVTRNYIYQRNFSLCYVSIDF